MSQIHTFEDGYKKHIVANKEIYDLYKELRAISIGLSYSEEFNKMIQKIRAAVDLLDKPST